MQNGFTLRFPHIWLIQPLLGNHLFFYPSYISLFFFPRIIRIVQNIAFLGGLRSLSNMDLRSLSFQGLVICFFSSLKNTPLNYVPQFDYPFTCWRTSWLFPVWVSYAYNFCKYLCAGFCVGVNFQKQLDEYLRVWLPCGVRLCLTRQEQPECLPKWLP